MVPTDIATTEPLVHDRCSIISVGRLNDGKGQGILIKALAVLRQHDFPVRLVLVGGVFPGQEHFRDELVRLANRLGVADAIEFAGERRDALQLVGRSDIFVMPSTRPESFGMALVEAMHLRRPVIATDIGGPREIIHHGRDGLLVPPGDPDALARAIRWLIENPEAARALAAAAQERAADFRETDLTETVLGLYEQFVPQAPSGSGREMSEAPWDDFPRLARTAVSET
jgi:glycosyltransferase involved in cell wall biosynthesis